MKKMLALLLAILIGLSLSACAEYQSEETLPTDPPGVTEDTTVATDPTEPPADPTTPTAEPDPLTAWVRTAREETTTLQESDGTTTEQTYRYPEVVLSGDEVNMWNYRLSINMNRIIELAQDAEEFCSTRYSSMDYSCWRYGDYLMVLLTLELTGDEYAEYQVAVFDTQTHEVLDKGELFCRVTGQEDPGALTNVIALNLGQWFDREYEEIAPYEDLTQLREQTVSNLNIRLTQLCLDEEGQLLAIVPAYTVAGSGMTTAFVTLTDFSPMDVDELPAEGAALEDLVSQYRNDRLVYTDSVGNQYDIPVNLPWVNLNTPDSRACNWEMQRNLEDYLDESIGYLENGASTSISEIGYDAWIWEGTLTVLLWEYTAYEYDTYYAYTFNLETGRRMTNQEIAARFGGEDSWQQTLCDAMGETYREKYPTLTDDPYYQEQLEKTIAPENAEASQLYPTEEGELMALCKIYPLAGADAYWHLVLVH